jgi:hypothetical protein
MINSMRLLTVLAAFAFCLPAAATETTPAAVQPAPAASAAPAADAAPAAAAEQAAPPAAAVTKVPSGYKAKVVNGETMLCRKSTPLGSRFPTEVCMTQAQYTEQMRNQDSLRQELTGKQKSYSNSQ